MPFGKQSADTPRDPLTPRGRAILTAIVAMLSVAITVAPVPTWVQAVGGVVLVGAAAVGIVPPQLVTMPGAVSTGYFTRPNPQKVGDAVRLAKSLGILPPDGIIKAASNVPALGYHGEQPPTPAVDFPPANEVPTLPPGAVWNNPADFAQGYHYPRPQFGGGKPEERL